MPDWRKAAGVLRGAIPPGETPESMIRRLRDGDAPTDADRALAVLDRLVRRNDVCAIELSDAADGGIYAHLWWHGADDPLGATVKGETVAAALLALGQRLEGDDGDE